MATPRITGVGLTPFGRHDGSTALGLMAQAAQAALDDAGLERGAIDGLLCGYATTQPHLMLSTLFAEAFALQPAYAHSLQLGGATGCAMLMLAGDLVRREGFGQAGDPYVAIAGVPFGQSGTTNLMHIGIV